MNLTIKQMLISELQIGDQILDYPYEKTPMVIVETVSPHTGNRCIFMRRLHGKKLYGIALPIDHLFLVQRSEVSE